MADLGNTSGAQSSTASGGPGHKTSSWVTVGIIVVGTLLLGIAAIVQSMPMGIVGAVITVIGCITGVVGRIMEDVH